MNPPPENVAEVQASLVTAAARVEIVRFDMHGPIDSVVEARDSYRLNLCLTPRPPGARSGFVEAWGPHRFEPLGEVFLIPPGFRLHSRSEGGRQGSVVCELDRAAVEAWLDGTPEWTDRRLEASLDVPGPRIRGLLGRLAEEAHRPGLAADALTGLIAGQLAIEVARFCAAIADGPAIGGLAAWRLRLIDERLRTLATPPSLDELARLCNLSIRQLTRGFRASHGTSVNDYVAHARIEGAKRLLGGDDSIKAIAFAVGFASPSSFSSAFRQATGITPRQFRATMRRTAG